MDNGFMDESYSDTSSYEHICSLKDTIDDLTEQNKRYVEQINDYLKLTEGLEDHPDWFNHGCYCRSCQSYATDDGDV